MTRLNETLLELRQKKKLNQNELAAHLKISVRQIELIESPKFRKLPRLTLTRILERYEKFFNLGKNELIKELSLAGEEVEVDLFKNHKKVFWFKPTSLLRNFLFLILIIFILYQFSKLILPPKIKIFYPSQNFVSSQNSLVIKGYLNPRNSLMINDEIITTDRNGNFQEPVLLRPGRNDFVFEGTNFWGGHSLLKRTIYYIGAK
ncbi:MAG: helix-turn-helix domain-containing protein [Patescibacteria group bacterium]|nr:helix-turn-helix domain-containing protein [Patescibacteria group bacterium]MCL5257947.1 helix-turn-helix domain-containing protein [Patescibacteria group bacterium]